MTPDRIALVPGVPAMLPEYSSLEDPVAELRTACLAAVSWLGEAGPVEVVGSAQGARVGQALLTAAGVSARSGAERGSTNGGGPTSSGGGDRAAYLLVGNGSACRSEKAPGHLDPRAAAFDDALGAALRAGDRAALAGLGRDLARELWADAEALVWLGEEIGLDGYEVEVDYDDDPFGVKYWVVRWTSRPT